MLIFEKYQKFILVKLIKLYSMIKIGIPVFPGSNCDKDIHNVLTTKFNIQADLIWHKKSRLKNYDAIIIPGGFSYGDRLRAGIIAAHSPIIKDIKIMAKNNIPILGICNGFQILIESGLLPGALIRNENLQFVCKWIKLIVEENNTPFTNRFKTKEIFKIPSAHGEGRYMIDKESLKKIKRNRQIIFRYYVNNPNGSIEHIAGISNEDKNIVGIMPHPERTCEKKLADFGLTGEASKIFESLLEYVK